MVIYRYLSKANLDKFKKIGELQVSPLKTYQTIGNSRQDKTDGLKIVHVKFIGKITKEEMQELTGSYIGIELGYGGTLALNLALPVGFVICASSILNDELKNHFKSDSYFRITNPKLFEKAVCRAIVEYFKGLAKVTILRNEFVRYVPDKTQYIVKIEDLRKIGPLRSSWVYEDYFIKNDEYKKENECRFLIILDGIDKIEKPILIYLTPEEINLCCSFED